MHQSKEIDSQSKLESQNPHNHMLCARDTINTSDWEAEEKRMGKGQQANATKPSKSRDPNCNVR